MKRPLILVVLAFLIGMALWIGGFSGGGQGFATETGSAGSPPSGFRAAEAVVVEGHLEPVRKDLSTFSLVVEVLCTNLPTEGVSLQLVEVSPQFLISYRPNHLDLEAFLTMPSVEAITDLAGTASFNRVHRKRNYVLIANKVGYAFEIVTLEPERGSDLQRRIRIELTEAPQLILSVLDENGAGVPAAKVWVLQGGDGVAGVLGRAANELGVATFPTLRDSLCAVTVEAVGFRPKSETFQVGSNPIFEAVIQLDRGRTLSGRVIDHQGQPVPGAAIFISPATSKKKGASNMLDFSGNPRALCGYSDDDGFFNASGFTGMHSLAVLAKKGNSIGFATGVSHSEHVEVVLGQTTSFLLKILTPEGEPCPGAEVAILDARIPGWPPRFRGSTNENGELSLRFPVDMECVVFARKGEWVFRPEQPTSMQSLIEGQPIEFQLQEGKRVSIRGVAEDSSVPLTNLRVGLQSPVHSSLLLREIDSEYWRKTFVNFLSEAPVKEKDGIAKLVPLLNGEYSIVLSASGFSNRVLSLKVVDAEPLLITVPMFKVAALNVWVRDSHGTLFRGATLRLEKIGGNVIGAHSTVGYLSILATTGPDGRATIPSASIGLWKLTAVLQDGRRKTIEVNLDSPQTATQVIFEPSEADE